MKKCPFLKKKCIEHECQLYTHLQGKSPQTGQDIDQYGCALEWIPILLVEQRAAVGGVQAATESFRNEMVKGNENLAKVMALGNPDRTDRTPRLVNEYTETTD